MLVALVCPNCQGALPAPAPGQHALTCPYCGVGVMLAPTAAPPVSAEQRRREQFKDFYGALLVEKNLPEALEIAVAQVWPGQDAVALARAVLRMLADFRAEAGIDARKDAMCVQRLLEAWLPLREQVAQGVTVTIDLPYFTADAKGPRHLQRQIAPADLARLEGRGP